MHLLNTKSILDCNEFEEEKHYQENQNVLSKLSNYPNYDCAAIIKYFDEANKDKEPIIKSCNLHNCDEMIEYVDSKNGVDIALVEDFLTFIVYGQGYLIKNTYNFTKVGIQIRPYNHEEFLNFNQLQNNEA